MSRYLDFAKIKEEHRIEDVARRLGLELTERNDQLRGKCPSGKGGDRALVITPKKQVWYSFGKQEGGDVIALVQLAKELPAKAAAEWIVGDAPEERAENAPKPAQEARGGFKALAYLEPSHEAVEALGFDQATAEALGIGYAPRGVLRGTVAVPVRNADGTIAGYIGLTEVEKLPPRWELT